MNNTDSNDVNDKYDRYSNLFERYLDNLEIKENNRPTEEERRIIIFKRALKIGAGIKWVESKLKKRKLRRLYVRNPLENALKHCFICNGTENAYSTYDFDSFKNLYRELTEGINIPLFSLREENDNKGIYTFGDLREYVVRTSKIDSKDSRKVIKTRLLTKQFEDSIDFIDVTRENARDDYIKKFRENLELLCESSQSVRYYFVKYIYFIICHQILELKKILLMFSEHSSSYYCHCLKDWDDKLNRWSLLTGVIRDANIAKIWENVGNDYQISKELLRATLNNFVLKGKSLNKDQYFKLLRPDQQLSVLRDKTSIFDEEKFNKEKHKEAVDIIKNMKISDFYGYSIKFSSLYNLLFNIINSSGIAKNKETGGKRNYKKEFIIDVLEGRSDLSRSAVLMFLASARGALFDSEMLLNSKDAMFDNESVLNVNRVDEILNKMGYVELGFNVGPDGSVDKIERLYHGIFSKSQKDGVVVLDALSDSIGDYIEDYQINPLPFEIENISAEEKRDLMTQ